jgi:hypothetical protein
MQAAINGVEMTRQHHQVLHFADTLSSTGSFIERLEIFLIEMDRRGLDGEPVSVQAAQTARRQATHLRAVVTHA